MVEATSCIRTSMKVLGENAWFKCACRWQAWRLRMVPKHLVIGCIVQNFVWRFRIWRPRRSFRAWISVNWGVGTPPSKPGRPLPHSCAPNRVSANIFLDLLHHCGKSNWDVLHSDCPLEPSLSDASGNFNTHDAASCVYYTNIWRPHMDLLSQSTGKMTWSCCAGWRWRAFSWSHRSWKVVRRKRLVRSRWAWSSVGFQCNLRIS